MLYACGAQSQSPTNAAEQGCSSGGAATDPQCQTDDGVADGTSGGVDGSSGGNGGGGAVSPEEVQEFFDVLNVTNADGPELTAEAALKQSTAVVTGEFVAVSDGRTAQYATGAPVPLNTAVFKIAVASTLKGEVREHVYAEFIRGAVPVEILEAAIPSRLPLLFLLTEATWPLDVYEVINEGRGVPTGATLYRWLPDVGIVAESEHGLAFPLNVNDWDYQREGYFGDAQSLAEAESYITSLVSSSEE